MTYAHELLEYGGILMIVDNIFSKSLTADIVPKKFNEFCYTPEMFRQDFISNDSLAYARCRAFLMTISDILNINGQEIAKIGVIVEIDKSIVILPLTLN
jgi:hypothetical protein